MEMENDDPIVVPLNRTKFAWDLVDLVRKSLSYIPGLEMSDQETFEVVQICLLPGNDRTAAIEALELAAGYRLPRLTPELSRTIIPASQSQNTQITWRGVPSNKEMHGERGPSENRFRPTDDASGLEAAAQFKNDCRAAIRRKWSGLSKREKRRFRGGLRGMLGADPGTFPVIHAFGKLVNDPFITNIPNPMVREAETIETLIMNLRARLAG
jgi:hypothetical protein